MRQKFIASFSKGFSLIAILISFFTFISISRSQALTEASRSAQGIKKEPLSEASKKWLEEVVPYIITPAEREVFLSLPNEEERGKFIENFWKRRDPNPQTPENEFKIAYYRRIALANKFFTVGGTPGWKTDRGRVFILLGPPSEIQSDYLYGRSSINRPGAVKEIWTYWNLPNPDLPYTLEFTFVDPYGTGDFKLETSLGYKDNASFPFNLQASHLFFDQLELLAEALRNPFEKSEKLQAIITTQVNYNLIPFNCDLFLRKGPEGRAQAIAFLNIPLASLKAKEAEGKNGYSLTLMLHVSNKLGEKILEKTQDFNFQIEAKEKPPDESSTYSIPLRVNLPPGEYGLHFLVLDNFSGKIGTLHKSLISPDFKTDHLAMSDLVLFSSTSGSEQGFSNWRCPLNEFRENEEITLEFEVYNARLSKETGQAHLLVRILFFREGNLITSASPLEHIFTGSTEGQIRTSFRLHNFQPGNYRLRVEVEDEISSASCFKEKELKIISD